jgi:hypothetical protein
MHLARSSVRRPKDITEAPLDTRARFDFEPESGDPRQDRGQRDQMALSTPTSPIPRISRNPSELMAEATSSETLRTSPAQLRFMTVASR